MSETSEARADGLLRLTRQQVRKSLHIPSPYYLGKGFSLSILDAMDVGHSPKLRRSITPVYDEAGQFCLGILGRSELPACSRCKKYHRPEVACRFGQGKWMTLKGFPKTLLLYNAAALHSSRPFVLLTEGAMDAVRAQEAGYPAVSSMGAHLSDAQAQRLAASGKEVLVAYDRDPAGRQAEGKALALLRAMGVRATSFPPPGGFKDLGEMRPEDVRAWMEAR
jgi:hypothetical protein